MDESQTTEQKKLPESTTTENEASQRSDYEKTLRIRKLWEQSNVPERHKMMSKVAGRVDLPDSRSGWSQKLDLLASRLDEGIMVVLHGPRGTGKTQLACCLVRDACLAELTAYYVTAMGFFLHLRSSFGDGPENERSIVKAYLSPVLLVIDEIDDRGKSAWEDRLLGYVVNERYANLRTTVMVTNETAEVAAKNLGSSITDRVRECGWFVECDWPSFRGVGS